MAKFDGSTLMDNLVRIVNEGTIGQFTINPSDIIDGGYILRKNTSIGRNIFYVLYRVNDDQYSLLNTLNQFRFSPSTAQYGDEFLMKASYRWFLLSDLLAAEGAEQLDARDVSGASSTITLRPYFYKDFVLHPNLQEIIPKL
jgi:hypothetical protein